jgi:hypothetical protein
MKPAKRMTLVLLGVLAVLLLSATPALAKVKDVNRNKIPDWWEVKYHLSLKKNLAAVDTDKDGLTNYQEYLAGTSPLAKDSNHNGITDPRDDTDHDGLANIAEFRAHTNPKVKDTNHNGITDAREDPDRDGLNNRGEYLCKTNPLVADTNRNAVSDFNEDPDKDGLPNGAEMALADNPFKADTNNNGVVDGLEIAGIVTGFDPATGVLSVQALGECGSAYDITVGDSTALSWNPAALLSGVPTLDDLKAGALVTAAEGELQADGTILATTLEILPGATTAPLVATVGWYDSEDGWLGLYPVSGDNECVALVDSSTVIAWAPGAYATHAASAGDLNCDVGVTQLSVRYNRNGDLVVKQILLVPNYAGDIGLWNDQCDGSSDPGDGISQN